MRISSCPGRDHILPRAAATSAAAIPAYRLNVADAGAAAAAAVAAVAPAGAAAVTGTTTGTTAAAAVAAAAGKHVKIADCGKKLEPPSLPPQLLVPIQLLLLSPPLFNKTALASPLSSAPLLWLLPALPASWSRYCAASGKKL